MWSTVVTFSGFDNRALEGGTNGADNLLFETDYPHSGCLYGNVREMIDSGTFGMGPTVRKKLLWENSARLYRIAEPEVEVPTIESAGRS